MTRITPSTVANSGFYYVAGIGNTTPEPASTPVWTARLPGGLRQSTDGNGGIIIFDPTSGGQPIVINQVAMPAIPANFSPYWTDSSSGSGFSSPAQPASLKRMSSRITSVTAKNAGNNITTIMFTDATGVATRSLPWSGVWTVDWMLPNQAYRVMQGVYNLYDKTSSREPVLHITRSSVLHQSRRT